MEAARTFETLVSYHITSWHHNSEELDLDLYSSKNLKLQNLQSFIINKGPYQFSLIKEVT